MTNSEYFEKNKISFAEVIEIFNEQKDNGISSFDEFLASEHLEHKYKFNVGDIIVLQKDRLIDFPNVWKHNAVLRIVRIDESIYRVEFLTPDGSDYIGRVRDFDIAFAENYCIPY